MQRHLSCGKEGAQQVTTGMRRMEMQVIVGGLYGRDPGCMKRRQRIAVEVRRESPRKHLNE